MVILIKGLIQKIVEKALRLWGCNRNCKVVADCDGSCRDKVCPNFGNCHVNNSLLS